MKRSRQTHTDVVDPLRQLIRDGKLFAVQEWLCEGKPIFVPSESKRWTTLQTAAATGFHSMVEVLVKAWKDQPSLNQALHVAIRYRRAEVAKLLVEHGADVNYPLLADVARCYSPSLMELFLQRGVEINRYDALAHAIIAQARPLIGVFRKYCQILPGGKEQLAKALVHFVREKSARWVCLALWMGADPRLVVADINEKGYEPSSAMEAAFWQTDMSIIKLLPFDPKIDDPTYYIGKQYPVSFEVTDYLISLGANINDKPNGGCHILDIGWADHVVLELLKRGAKFAPETPYDYRQARQAVLSLARSHRRELLKCLPGAAGPEDLVKLVDTPKMRELLGTDIAAMFERAGVLRPPAKRRLPPEYYERRRESRRKARETARHVVTEPGTHAATAAPPAAAVAPPPRPVSPPIPKRRVVTNISRQELYEQVWSKPTRQLARQCGLSDVGLAKVLRKHSIPKPPRGYWAKLQAGKETPKRVLLSEPERNPSIVIRGSLPLINVGTVGTPEPAR